MGTLTPIPTVDRTHAMFALGIGNRRRVLSGTKIIGSQKIRPLDNSQGPLCHNNNNSLTHKILKMGKHSRSSVGGAGESKKSKTVKSLVADEAVVDPGLAALFASSVSTALSNCLKMHRLTQSSGRSSPGATEEQIRGGPATKKEEGTSLPGLRVRGGR